MTKKMKYDLIGKKIGILTVVKRVENTGKYKDIVSWLCKCDCGKEIIKNTPYLIYEGKNIKHCGCLNYYPDGTKINKDPGTARGIMAKIIGRPLTGNELVHHKNGIRSDNRPKNLELCGRRNHPYAQRVKDMIPFCLSYLRDYTPSLLIKGEKTRVRHAKEKIDI